MFMKFLLLNEDNGMLELLSSKIMVWSKRPRSTVYSWGVSDMQKEKITGTFLNIGFCLINLSFFLLNMRMQSYSLLGRISVSIVWPECCKHRIIDWISISWFFLYEPLRKRIFIKFVFLWLDFSNKIFQCDLIDTFFFRVFF